MKTRLEIIKVQNGYMIFDAFEMKHDDPILFEAQAVAEDFDSLVRVLKRVFEVEQSSILPVDLGEL